MAQGSAIQSFKLSGSDFRFNNKLFIFGADPTLIRHKLHCAHNKGGFPCAVRSGARSFVAHKVEYLAPEYLYDQKHNEWQ